MPIRRVVRNEIEQDLQPATMRGRDQRVEIRQGSKDWIDVGVVRNIVAEISHRRRKDRRDPDRVDAEIRQIRQPLRDALKIADPVVIGILK